MRPNEAWGEESNERFECIDANTCEDRVNEWLSAEFDSYLETLDANAQAEEATAETFRAEERHEVEEEEDRPVYLAELSSEERARIGVSDDDIV